MWQLILFCSQSGFHNDCMSAAVKLLWWLTSPLMSPVPEMSDLRSLKESMKSMVVDLMAIRVGTALLLMASALFSPSIFGDQVWRLLKGKWWACLWGLQLCHCQMVVAQSDSCDLLADSSHHVIDYACKEFSGCHTTLYHPGFLQKTVLPPCHWPRCNTQSGHRDLRKVWWFLETLIVLKMVHRASWSAILKISNFNV